MCLLIKAEMEHCLLNRQTLFTSFCLQRKEEEGRKGRRKRGKEKMFEIVLIFEEARRWPIIHLRILSFSSIS